MPEADTFENTFKKISVNAVAPVISLIALAIDAPGTVIWYDHHEDGYESDYISGNMSSTTEIWGDGDLTNGCAPTCSGGSCYNDVCTSDILYPGQSIVLQESIDIYSSGPNRYDGGDKITSSYPIAVTRGAYPQSPGSLMAGAIEVLETSEWGTYFVSPVGQDMSGDLQSGFQHCAFYVMAEKKNTILTFSDGTGRVLGQGEGYTHIIDTKGETLTTSEPVQVHLITGDEGSSYELRWFSLLPRDQWSRSYFSPVGDSVGELRVLLYNPNASGMNVQVELKNNMYDTYYVLGNSYAYTGIIPTGSGAAMTAPYEFIALSLTDTKSGTNGQIYDWGFPVLPLEKLTTQVLVGWGFGCTNNNCGYSSERSVVWVSPVAACDIYVDTDNDGIPESGMTVTNAQRLSSNIFIDGADKDMSGAIIWAVQPNQPHDSSLLVEIAAAWGQDSAKSYSGDGKALDLGTLIPPFNTVRVNEVVTLKIDQNGDGLIGPGDTCQYTIRVQNLGQRDYGVCQYKIVKPGLQANLPRQHYVSGTCEFSDGSDSQECSDDSLVSDNGLCNPLVLPKKGGEAYITFDVVIGEPEELDDVQISDKGTLSQPGLGPDLPFSAPEICHLNPEINIEKTVHKGTMVTCSNGSELEYGPTGDIVTFCYEVTNTGNAYLDNVKVTDPNISMPPDTSIPRMEPGAKHWVKFQTTIPSQKKVEAATVVADPILVNGNDIATYSSGPVTDSDDAGVDPVASPPSNPAIKIEKTVHLGKIPTCFNGQELEYGLDGEVVTYCYKSCNKGDIALDVVVTDTGIGFASDSFNLPVGDCGWARKDHSIKLNLTSDGVAVGSPTDGNSDDVSDSDPAGVELVAPTICVPK
jgi:hypothetical protein